ncbi:MAG: diguanylate cyclase [Clostridia bacterium]|nr:diguanylate cyclase [Clostridia bacterium]
MKSIQTKILVVVIAGLLVITAVVSAIAVNMTHEVMHRDADRILKNATQREAAQINDVLGDVMKSSSIMEHYAVTELNSADDLKDEAFRAEYLQNAEVMFSEVALNTTDIEGFYLRLDPSVADGTSGFYKMLQTDGSLKDMMLTDLTQYDQDDVQNVGWYYAAVKSGKGVWLDPYYFPGHNNQLISFVQPMYCNRQLIGVIGFDMNFNYLIKRIDEIAVYEDGHAILLSKDGATAYNAVPEGHSHNPHTESKVELKNGMFLQMGADYQDIQRDIRPMLVKIVLAFLTVLACAIVYTVIVTQKIVGPLKRLTSAAESLSMGVAEADFSQVPVQSKDEIGTLSKVLTNTYAKIQEYTSYINALAYRDSLTGIKNSTAYTEAIDELNKTIRTGNPQFGVLVADINNLKETNDRYGHDIGNELIIHTSKVLTDTFKTSAVFRIGGDEFAVLLQGDDYKQYRSLLEKLDDAYAHDFVSVCNNQVPVAVARGVALFDPEIDRVYEDVFSKADHAMYLHKEQSKIMITN